MTYQARRSFTLAALVATLITTPACSTNGGSHLTATPPPSGLPGARLYAGNTFVKSVTVFQGPFSSSSTAAGSIALTVAPGGIAVDPTDATGAVYVSNSNAGVGQILKFARPNPNGAAPTVTVSGLQSPGAINFDSNGNLYVPDLAANKVFVVNHPITGTSVPSAVIASGLSSPLCVALDASNTLYVVDVGGALRAYAPPYTGAPVSTSLTIGNPAVCAYDRAANTLFVGSINAGTVIQGFALPLTASEAPGVTLTTAACCPGAIAFDSSGNVFISLGIDIQSAIAVAIPPFTGSSSFLFPAADYVRQLALGP